MKNCAEDSVIKILANSSMKVNKNCELESKLCHNVMRLYKHTSQNVIVYHNSIKIYNLTATSDSRREYENLKKQELVRMVIMMSGFRNPPIIGLHCNNSVLKLENSEKTFKVMMMTTKIGDTFRLINNLTLEDGISCIETTLVAKRNDN